MNRLLKPGCQVREARREDLETVSRIESLSFKDPYPRSFLAALFALHSHTFLVATLPSGEVIGYIVTAVRYGIIGHILSIATRPDYRRRGVATALLQETLQILRSGHVQMIRLEARLSNSEALSLYERLGFENGEVEENYYPDGESAQVMYKRL